MALRLILKVPFRLTNALIYGSFKNSLQCNIKWGDSSCSLQSETVYLVNSLF